MKNTPLTDELKPLFTDIQLPPLDVRERVMMRVMSGKEERNSMFNKRRLVIMFVLAAFLFCAMGFAAIEILELKGPGNTPYKYQLVDKGDPFPDSDQYRDAYEKLLPGQLLAVMRVKDNPKDTIHILQKPIVIQDLSELVEKLGDRLVVPAALPVGFSFSEGHLNYKQDEAYIAQMTEELKTSDKDYLVKVLEPTKKIANYSLLYKKGPQELNVSLFFDWIGNDIFEVSRGKHVEKVKIKDFEAVYTDSDGRSEIKWLKTENGSNTFYSIGTPSGDLSKESLIQIADSMP